MKDATKKRGWLSSLLGIFEILDRLIGWFSGRKRRQEIEEARDELSKALADGRITDAAYWRKRLANLTASQ